MSDCCQPDESSPPAAFVTPAPECPRCGRVGKPVGVRTVKHQVKPAFLSKADAGNSRFCATPDCPAVYYTPAGETLVTADLRQPVTQKTPTNPPLCYCFGFDEAMVREEIRATGRSSIADRITAEVRAGHCACEIRNPQGSCCLGNIRASVARATDAYLSNPAH